ncbi:hypothetical protein ACUUL3_04765 [Thiovibrio sp. JS02]
MKRIILLAWLLLAPSVCAASNLVTLDFDGVDIKQLTMVYADVRGKAVMYPDDFSEIVRLISPRPVMPQVFFAMYEDLLRSIGYNLFEFRNYIRISRQIPRTYESSQADTANPEPLTVEGPK